MKRFEVEYKREDKRGKLIQVLSWGVWQQLNILVIKRKEVFGGHYHRHKAEFFYILSGKVRFNGIEMQTGDCIWIEPLDIHTIDAITDTIIVELLSDPYSEEDTFTEKRRLNGKVNGKRFNARPRKRQQSRFSNSRSKKRNTKATY